MIHGERKKNRLPIGYRDSIQLDWRCLLHEKISALHIIVIYIRLYKLLLLSFAGPEQYAITIMINRQTIKIYLNNGYSTSCTTIVAIVVYGHHNNNIVVLTRTQCVDCDRKIYNIKYNSV